MGAGARGGGPGPGAGTGFSEHVRREAEAERVAAALLNTHKQAKKPNSSPEKKAKHAAEPVSKGPTGLRSPTLFRIEAPSESTKRPLPEAYHIGDDAPPPWAAQIQQGIARLDKGQREQLQALQTNTQVIQNIADKVQSLEVRQDSPARTCCGPRIRSPPAANAPGGGSHDDWQIVLGGWREAKRDEVELEVREWFRRASCEPLLQAMYCSSVRTNTCRVDLLYMQENLADRRKVQNMCVEAFRTAARPSSIQGQPTGVLWAKRNRSPEERARIRAIVSLKSLVAQHLAPRDFEFDWRGRFWAQGVSVLAHVDQKQPTDGALLLLDVRGEETGWWVPGPLLAQVLKISLDDLHAHFKVDGKPYEGGRGKRRTQAHKPELVAGTWNLHGKGVTDLQDLWPGNVVFPDILLLQELGACPEATPEVQVSTLFLGPKVYQMYLVGRPRSTPMSSRSNPK